jgi:hypothetical protein
VAIEHGVYGADRGEQYGGTPLAQLLPNLRRAPARILALQPDDGRLNGHWQPIRLSIRAPTAIRERVDPAVLTPVEDLVARLARDAELGAQRRHLDHSDV